MRNAGSDTITIKIRRETHAQLGDLIKMLTGKGWGCIDVVRSDAPTFATVVEAAVDKLVVTARARKKTK